VTINRAAIADSPELLESLLVDAYCAEIPQALAATLDKLPADLAGRGSQPARLPRPAQWWRSLPRRRRLTVAPVLVSVLLTAAFLVGTSASGGPAAFYDEDGGYMWQHAQVLRMDKVVDGYRITLERAYADANQMLVGITVVDTQNRSHDLRVGKVSVADSAGGTWENTTGGSDPVNVTTTASLYLFDHDPGAAPSGRRKFSVTVATISGNSDAASPQDVPVNAEFDFELTVPAALEATPRASAVSNGVTLTVDRIITSPSAVRMELSVAGAPSSGHDWTPIARVSHAGRELNGGHSSIAQGSALTILYTGDGVDDPTGDWTVTAGELMGSAPTEGSPWEHEVRVQGDWTIKFTLP